MRVSYVLLGLSAGCEGAHEALVRELADVVSAQRLIVPRLAGPYAYAPCERRAAGHDDLIPSAICSGPTSDHARLARLDDLGLRIGAAVSRRPTARNFQVAGQWQLRWPDDPRSLDSAIALFEASLALDSTVADVHSDLAAAYLVRAGERDAPEDLVAALEHAIAAWERDSLSAHIAYNAALAFQGLFRDEAAAAAWTRVAAAYGDEGWGREAGAELARLAGREPVAPWEEMRPEFAAALEERDRTAVANVVRRRPRRAREYVLSELLPAWARAEVSSSSGVATTLLERAELIAGLHADVTDDHMLPDVVRHIEAAGSSRERWRLAVGIDRFGEGLALFREPDFDEAAEVLAAAVEELAATGSPLSDLARYYLAAATFRSAGSDGSASTYMAVRRQLRALREAHAVQEYPVLLGEIRYYEGLMAGVVEQCAESKNAYLHAAELLEERDVNRATAAHASAAWAIQCLGADGGWRARYRALSLVRRVDLPSPHFQVLVQLADAAERLGYYRVSLHFLEANISASLESNNYVRGLRALLHLADLHHATGDVAAAARDLDEATRISEFVNDGSTRDINARDLQLARARLNRRSAPRKALRQLEQVIAMFRADSSRVGYERALLTATDACIAIANHSCATEYLDSALAEIIRQSDAVEGGGRADFMDNARPSIDRIVSGYLEAGLSAADAFQAVERGRARVLLAETGIEDALPTDSIQSRLADSVGIVSYTMVDGQVLIWLITQMSVHLDSVPIGAHDLQRLAERVASLGHVDENTFDSTLSELSRILIDPIRPRLAGVRRIVFVPDRWMHFVPWKALVVAHVVSVAPSATFFVSTAEEVRQLPSLEPHRVLAVGVPESAPSLGLSLLPHAGEEAERVAALYGDRSLLLVGAEATPESIAALAPQFDILHLAAHALVDPRSPSRSRLVLAPGITDGTLNLADIEELGLARMQLVILSGCHTAGGILSATEGPSSFARAFMSAGVPSVIATLWPVDDADASAFAVAVHEELVAGLDAASALNRVQNRWMKERPGSARVWATFQLIGASFIGSSVVSSERP